MPKAGFEEGGIKRIKCFRGFHCMKAPLAVGKAGLGRATSRLGTGILQTEPPDLCYQGLFPSIFCNGLNHLSIGE